jgi:hypothetical protein
VNGGISVNNNNWDKTEKWICNYNDIKIRCNWDKYISAIGFSIERKLDAQLKLRNHHSYNCGMAQIR